MVIAGVVCSRYTRAMLVVTPLIVLMIVAPLIAWRRYRTSSSLFVAAAIVWGIYVLGMAMTHGFSKTFTEGARQITLDFGPQYIRWVASLAVPAIVLLGMDRWGITPNRRAMFGLFWAYSLFLTIAVAAAHIYSGYQYPPIALERLSPVQLEMLALVLYYSNAGYLLSRWVLLGLIAWPVVLRTPALLKSLLVAIRGL